MTTKSAVDNSSYKLKYCYLSKVAVISFKLMTAHRKELWLNNIKQAIQGLFTAGTSP